MILGSVLQQLTELLQKERSFLVSRRQLGATTPLGSWWAPCACLYFILQKFVSAQAILSSSPCEVEKLCNCPQRSYQTIWKKGRMYQFTFKMQKAFQKAVWSNAKQKFKRDRWVIESVTAASDRCEPWLCAFGRMGLMHGFLNSLFYFLQNFGSSVKVSSQNINVSLWGSQIKVEWLQVWVMRAGTASHSNNRQRHSHLHRAPWKDFSTRKKTYVAFWHYLRSYSAYGWLFNV